MSLQRCGASLSLVKTGAPLGFTQPRVQWVPGVLAEG